MGNSEFSFSRNSDACSASGEVSIRWTALSGLATLCVFLFGCGSIGAIAVPLDVPESADMSCDWVFERAPFTSCHASTIVEVAPGKLLVAFFAGTSEGNPDVGIWGSHGASRADNSVDWSSPTQLAHHPNVPCWNPVLHKATAGELLLFYKAGPSPQTWSGYLKRSRDGGTTWSDAEPLPAGILGPIKNKPIELPDGRLVCGSSVESHRAWACWIEISPDAGRTWSKHGPISVAGETFGIIQPTVFETACGRLRLLCRSTRRIGRICESTSTDGGLTWSPAKPSDLPNPNSGIDAVRLRDGRILLVYNHSTTARTPLNVAVSEAGGGSFRPWFKLESSPGEYSYPAVIQASDGRVHTTYTWNRKRIKHVSFDPMFGLADEREANNRTSSASRPSS